MKHKLSNIVISHISLVKAGANGKQIIYKSAATEPTYQKEIEIKKQDDEKGVIYGIVYSPDETDSQGDRATADEIQKAAYNFMKNKATRNVDKDHDFINKDAFIAESWIVRKNDEIFPNEKTGSWAVAVQLESDELKTAVKKGEIAGLSMAGTATKEALSKDELDTFSKFANLVAKMFSQKEKEEIDLQKALEPLSISYTQILKANEDLKKENATLSKRVEEIEAVLQKSKQNTSPKASNSQGVL